MVKFFLILTTFTIAIQAASAQSSPSVFIPETTEICDCDSLNAACYTPEFPAHCVISPLAGYPDSLVTDEYFLVRAPVFNKDSLSLIPFYRHSYTLNFPDNDSGIINLREGGILSYKTEGMNAIPQWVKKGNVQTFELIFRYPDGSGISIDVWQGNFRVVFRENKKTTKNSGE